MKKNLMLAVAASVLMFGAMQVNAQAPMSQEKGVPANPPAGAVVEPGRDLMSELKLTDKQKAELDKIRTASKDKIMKIDQEMKVFRDKISAVREEEEVAFEKILNDGQSEIFKKFKAEREAKIEEQKKRFAEIKVMQENERKAKLEDAKK